ncbi:MAG: OmpA family protein, partial [Planctomycetota bacterium]
MKRILATLLAGMWIVPMALGQGLQTTATKDDWEEINFEFNSPILSDGYPSLLRMAELLGKNPSFKVKLEGHTDWIGSEKYNEKLGMARAATVKSFLVKYGAASERVEAVTYGKKQPKVDNKTKEGRFMNRRVYMTVTDGQGRVIGAGGVADAIRAMQEQGAAKQMECCGEILKRLDRLDDILALLKDLKGENAALRQELDSLKKDQSALAAKVDGAPKPLSRDETASIVQSSAADAADKALDRYDKAQPKRFSLLGANIGADA